MATLADVKLWYVDRGIGHVVASQRSHWLFTGCGIMTNGDAQKKRPRRKCRKCMERLPEAKVVMEEAK